MWNGMHRLYASMNIWIRLMCIEISFVWRHCELSWVSALRCANGGKYVVNSKQLKFNFNSLFFLLSWTTRRQFYHFVFDVRAWFQHSLGQESLGQKSYMPIQTRQLPRRSRFIYIFFYFFLLLHTVRAHHVRSTPNGKRLCRNCGFVGLTMLLLLHWRHWRRAATESKPKTIPRKMYLWRKTTKIKTD